MSSSKFSDEFKRDAVAQITERGYLDLSRFRAAPGARLSHLSLEGDRAFPA